MRADRLLAILLHLQINRQMTARELAKRLEVSERTIHRDMEALSSAGVPVFAERGTGGGWFLPSSYQTKLTGLNEPEIQALFLSGSSTNLLSDLGLHHASESALLKLLVALPTLFRRDAEFARQRIHIDAAGWYSQKDDVPHLLTLQDALWQERKLLFSYQRTNTIVERQGDPLGLVAKGQTWYLVAQVEGDLRSYRVSRILAAQVLTEPAERPESFDLAAFWEQSTLSFKANLPRYPVTLRTSPTILARLRQTRHYPITQEGLPDADGWVHLTMQFQVEFEAREYLLSHGPQIEVLEPLELREDILANAEGIVALYTRNS
jgi:predicted DNA-binding transcriptional regulator YafY